MDIKRQRRNDPLELLVGHDGVQNLQQIRILVVGAGGLGCEILKNLVSSGFKHVDVIDMDTIELTNLNRQFLFSDNDIGKPKAEVAAQRVGGGVTPHVNRIENMPDDFYTSFHIVICGLDSVQARRWINAKLVDLCFSDASPMGLRPLIDGGSEGFRGQSRVILPGITPCYECTLDLVLDGDHTTSYPLCTIASLPRLPEHCIEWAKIVRWPQVFGMDRAPDLDSEEDMKWLFETAKSRATQYNIDGVTLELAYGVLKHIVPAVASTNAIIAATCSLEALKLATGVFDPISNYFMYTGDNGTFGSVFEFQKRENCAACGTRRLELNVDSGTLLQQVLHQVQLKLGCTSLPSMSTNEATLYMSTPSSLRRKLEPNLSKTVGDLTATNDSETIIETAVTHPDLPFAVRVLLSIN